jgi:hypothetical protein
MSKNKKGHGIVLDDKDQELPTIKNRAQSAHETEPGRPGKNDDELQPLRGGDAFVTRHLWRLAAIMNYEPSDLFGGDCAERSCPAGIRVDLGTF